jgi:hypothetical protein
MTSKLSIIGISVVVSTAVVMLNNYFLYRHSCSRAKKVEENPDEEQVHVQA